MGGRQCRGSPVAFVRAGRTDVSAAAGRVCPRLPVMSVIGARETFGSSVGTQSSKLCRGPRKIPTKRKTEARALPLVFEFNGRDGQI
jgi:hypothetical protein